MDSGLAGVFLRKFLKLVIVPLILQCSIVAASAWQATVVTVVESDSIVVQRETKRERIDLYGIDCPEKSQDFGDVAKKFTLYRTGGKAVEVEQVGKSRYGRAAGIVTVEGKNLNLELVQTGLAWVHNASCTRPECQEWRQAQKQARHRRLGVWSTSNPLPPWEFRKSRHSEKRVYGGNIVSRVFHSTHCEEFDCWDCIVMFKGREEALNAGYRPCELCNP